LNKKVGVFMATLYERIHFLCEQKGIKGARMCTDLGFSKSLMTDLKMGRKKGVNADTAQKIASYFDVSVGYLLGEEENKKSSPGAEEKTPRERKYDEIISLLQALPEEKVTEAIRYLRYLAEN
jgi:transcriptional regulator with XRE-family HTH domain